MEENKETENKGPIKLNDNDYELFYSGEKGSEVMVITLPIRKWSENKVYGDIYISGLFAKAERVALKNVQLMRSQEAQKGIIPTNGNIPLRVS